jgi:hypothetical protein
MRRLVAGLLLVGLLLSLASAPFEHADKKKTPTPTQIHKVTPVSTATPTATETVLPTATATHTSTSVPSGPYPGAPLCATHDPSRFHTLWDSARGCHYDHEHGEDPFTAEVANAFPDFDLRAALGYVEMGHQHPTSPAEFSAKHAGLKWQVSLGMPCVGGFESAVWCVTDAVVQYHAFGPQHIELEARVHSTVALLRVCEAANPTNCGVIFAVLHQDYGQRVAPYQGTVLPYPDNPTPYQSGLGPYWSLDCFGLGLPNCRTSLAYVRDRNLNANSTITSKGGRTGAQGLFNLLIRVRDNYQLLDSADLVHPFTFGYVCGEAVYNPVGCRYNNSTTRIHEVGGLLPGTWDGASFDADPRAGYVTGALTVGGFPFILVNAPVGVRYGTNLCPDGVKCSNPDPASNPERDIYFCGQMVCSETSPGAVPSGWIGAEN